MMKLVVLALFLATAIDATSINCYQTQTDGTVVDKACEADDVTQCQGPVFIYTGLSDVDYACGPCADDLEATCKTCDSAKCNAEPEFGDDYECAVYKWVADDTKYAADAAMTTCKSLKDTEKNLCNKPGTKALLEADFTSQNKGCGPCLTDDKTAEKCEETNSAVSMTALLLPLIAALYALF